MAKANINVYASGKIYLPARRARCIRNSVRGSIVDLVTDEMWCRMWIRLHILMCDR